jgi:DNA-binding NarL/FixJ family response regulator
MNRPQVSWHTVSIDEKFLAHIILRLNTTKRQTYHPKVHDTLEAKPIRVALVEDDEEIRANLTYRIEGNPIFSLMGAYPDAESALADLPQQTPDVVLMDINLPGMDGVECVRRLKLQMGTTQFVMLTVYEDSNRLFKSLVAGASGYLLKRTTPAKLLAAIREAHSGGSPMTPQIARLVVQHFQRHNEPSSEIEKLTSREKEVLDQLAKGFRYKEIVDNLVISEGTLHSHIRNIYDKLRVHSRTEAVIKYLNP